MNQLFVLVFACSLVACGRDVHISEINWALEACKPYGGLVYVGSTGKNVPVTAFCHDHTRIESPKVHNE